MSSIVLGSSAGALALLYYLQQKKRANGIPVPQEAPSRRSHEPPNTLLEKLVFCKDVFSFMLTETVGRWHTMDLFVGLAYLAHRPTTGYPAADIAARGVPISLDPSADQAASLAAELSEIRRYMLYCRGLKHKRPDLQRRFWVENLNIRPDQIIRHEERAGVLRPAYVLIRDEQVGALVLCIRGTQEMKDLFTSLTGATKPHHMVTEQGGVVLGYSHQGMLTAARGILRQLVPPQGPSPLVSALNDAGPGFGLRVVGHSMGGGTAVMLTMMLREHQAFADARCIALACPACMTLELAQSCRDYVTTVVNGTDIVPTFCSATVDTLREDVTASSWFLEFQRDLRSSVTRAWKGSMRGMGNAGQWTSRNILQPVALPFRSCYSLSSRTAHTSCGRAAAMAAAGSNDEFLVATGMDELLLFGSGGGGRGEVPREDEDGDTEGTAYEPGSAPAPASAPTLGAPQELPPPSIGGQLSRKPSWLSMPQLLSQQQRQQQQLPSSPLSERTMVEMLRSCLYADHLEACNKAGRRRTGHRRGLGRSASTSVPDDNGGPGGLQGREGEGMDSIDVQQARQLLEGARLGSAAPAVGGIMGRPQGGMGEPQGALGGPLGSSMQGESKTGDQRKEAAATLFPSVQRRLGLWGAEQQPLWQQYSQQHHHHQYPQQQQQQPHHHQHPQQQQQQQQQEAHQEEEQEGQQWTQNPAFEGLELPLLPQPQPAPPPRGRLQGMQASWGAAQRAALSAGSWLWASMTTAGKQGSGGAVWGGGVDSAGDLGLETLADNGAGASLLISASPAKPAPSPPNGSEGRLGGRGDGEGLRPRGQMLGRLRAQLFAKEGTYVQGVAGQQGPSWPQQQQQQGFLQGESRVREQVFEDSDGDGSGGSVKEEDEDELEIGIDAAEELDDAGAEAAVQGDLQSAQEGADSRGKWGQGDRGGGSHHASSSPWALDKAEHQLEAGISAVVAAVTHESAQHSSGAGGAGFGGHGAALGGGVRDRELQEHLATSSYDHAKPPSSESSVHTRASGMKSGIEGERLRGWSEDGGRCRASGHEVDQGLSGAGVLGGEGRHRRSRSKSIGSRAAEHGGAGDEQEDELCGRDRVWGGGLEGSSSRRAEAIPAPTRPVYAPKRLYPAGRVLHFFPLSVVPGYEELEQQQQQQQHKEEVEVSSGRGDSGEQQGPPDGQQQPQQEQQLQQCGGQQDKDTFTGDASGSSTSWHQRMGSNSFFSELGGSATWDAGTAAAACAEDPVAAAVAATAAAAVGRSKSSGAGGMGAAARVPGPAARDDSGLLLADVAPAPQPWVLMEVPHHEAYGRVKLCKRMVVDHFVYSYLQALDSVAGQLQQHLEGVRGRTEPSASAMHD